MKPIKLGLLPSSKCVLNGMAVTLQYLINYTKRLTQGTFEIFDSCDQPKLIKHLANCFYKADARYTDFTVCNNSIKWHCDDDNGLLALWLVYSEDMTPQLITKHGATIMMQDDVVVFNAMDGHAWICNGVAVFVTATVSRIKK